MRGNVAENLPAGKKRPAGAHFFRGFYPAALAFAPALFLACAEEEKAPEGVAVPIDEVEKATEEITPKVTVYNGCGVEGLAGSAAGVLEAAGYEVQFGNLKDPRTGQDDFSRKFTEVYYAHDECREDADEAAGLLGVTPARVLKAPPTEGPDITVVLGADFDPASRVVRKGAETVAGDDFDWSASPVRIKLGPPPGSLEDGLYVSKTNHTVTLFADGVMVAQYPCATGRDGSTPEGTFKVNMKLVDPVWYWKGEAIPPGPDNGLGSRFIGITNDAYRSGYGIHGNNKPGSIGRDASHGCIRMHNEDVETLYELVDEGTTVVIGP